MPDMVRKQRTALLHLWNQGMLSAKNVHAKTKIPLSTIYCKSKKLEKYRKIQSAREIKKLVGKSSRRIGQYIRRNPAISLRTLSRQLTEQGVNSSYVAISRHLKRVGYNKPYTNAYTITKAKAS